MSEGVGYDDSDRGPSVTSVAGTSALDLLLIEQFLDRAKRACSNSTSAPARRIISGFELGDHRIRRHLPPVATDSLPAEVTTQNYGKGIVEAAGVEGSSLDTRIREDHVAPSTNEVAIDAVADPRDQALSHAVLQAVLDGDYERARRLAEEWRRLAANAAALRLVK